MWLATRLGFFSVVCARTSGAKGAPIDPTTMMVRVRSRQHLRNLQAEFPELKDLKIHRSKSGDYCARLFVPKALWVRIATELAEDVDYDNFKSACSARPVEQLSDPYLKFLSSVWSAGGSLQCEEEGYGPYGQVRLSRYDHLPAAVTPAKVTPKPKAPISRKRAKLDSTVPQTGPVELRSVVDALERLASDQDPVTYKGEDTTPRDLLYRLGNEFNARDLRLDYSATPVGSTVCRLVKRGTIIGMLRDRERMDSPAV